MRPVLGHGLLVPLVLLFLSPSPAGGQDATALEAIHFSGDIHTQLPATGGGLAVQADEAIAEYSIDSATADAVLPLGVLDAGDIDAFHAGDPDCGTDDLFSVETFTQISGTAMSAADVFTNAGIKVLDASAEGIPAGVNVDAVSRDPSSCDLVFSVDTITELSGTVFRPGDLVLRTGPGNFALYQDGAELGNVDALHLLSEGRVLFSVDQRVELGAVTASDEDVVERIPGSPSPFYALAFSPGDTDASWQPANLDALWAQRAPDFGSFRWDDANVEVLENAGSLSLTIERIDGAEGSVSVTYTTVDDSAVAGTDYVADAGTAEFIENELTETVTITITDNAAVQGDRTFFVDLTAATEGGLSAPTRVTVLIRDDEDFLFADGFEQ